MSEIDLPDRTAPGPTGPECRAIAMAKLRLDPDDHVVDVGAGTGAVSIEAAQRADRVTAIERDPDRAAGIERNLAANDVDNVAVRTGDAPGSLPAEADAVFVGGTRRLDAVIDRLADIDPRHVVVHAARMAVATDAIAAFETRGWLEESLAVRIDRGQSLAGTTALDPERPVFVVVAAPGKS
ncbi:MAG: precorrin-6Y C5,15-methyltransferase (decarboxylating) subunit CbiT [Halococcoides sp.]